jgi:hypothetical protein
VIVVPTDEESVIASACKNNIGEMTKKYLSRWENEGGTTAQSFAQTIPKPVIKD